MRILVLCDRYPYPLENGQNLRIFHYVSRLQARHEFELACYADGPPPEPVTAMFRSVRTFSRPRGTRGEGAARVLKAFDVQEFFPFSERVGRHLRDGQSQGRWDLVWISGWDMVVNVPSGFGVPILMDAVDDGVLEHWREIATARSFPRFARSLKRLYMNYRFERTYFAGKDAVLFVSDVDAACFRRIAPGTPTFVVNNGVDVHHFRPTPESGRGGDIVFEGNMHFPPNEDAAAYLVRDILPRVTSVLPDARVTLVGKDPSPGVRALQGPHVEVTGFVPDVRPYLDAAAVFACPMRKGAGIKNKVLQAWAMGKPVVATSKAAGGLQVIEGENILIRDTPEAFADALVTLLEDRGRREALATAARTTVERAYTWDRQATLLEHVMSAVASRNARAAL